MSRAFFVACFLTVLAAASASAQQDMTAYDPGGYVVRAVRIPGLPVIDGRLDEPAWERAEPATGFVQRNPVEGAPASERTEIRILYNNDTLYIGARMFEAHPEDLVVTQMRRDSMLQGDEYLDIVIDTFHDHRNAFQFQINPAGARSDAYITDEGKDINRDFNLVWEAATTVDALGWTAEIAIPFRQLRFPDVPGEQVWGINFYRNLRHLNEEVYWVPTPRDFGYRAISRLSNAGQLVGLEGLRSGRNFQLKPYGLAGGEITREKEDGTGRILRETDVLADTGLDLKVGLSTNLTLDLTFNTDFAQVEADQERVNLTRFSLFFPEKRDFFLEGAGIFGGTGGGHGPGGGERGGSDLQLFYSRRIGLSEGQEVPILGGSKLTGRVGGWTVGAMNVVTDEKWYAEDDTTDVFVPTTLWSVVSLRRNVLSRSSVGLLAASKDARDGDFNRTVGLDANFALGRSTSLTGQLAGVFDPDIVGILADGNNLAYSGRYRFDSDLWEAELQYRQVGEEFEPETGYIRRTGLRETSGQVGWSPRPDRLGIRQVSFGLEGSYLTDLADRLETRRLEFRIWTFMENTANYFLTLQRQYDLVPEDFTVYYDPDTEDEVVIPAGPYEWDGVSVRINSDGRRPLGLRGGGSFGGYYGGTRLSGNIDLSWRPSANLNSSLNWNRNLVWDAGVGDVGSFQTDVLSLRVNYAFTPNLFTKAYVQYNDLRNTIVANYLLHWILRDGTEIYLVYNEGYATGAEYDRPFATGRTLMLKATYLMLW